jgi:hypothetical protein
MGERVSNSLTRSALSDFNGYGLLSHAKMDRSVVVPLVLGRIFTKPDRFFTSLSDFSAGYEALS